MNKYIEEGMKSFQEKKAYNNPYNNPYKSGSDQYNNFDRGWTQALKRSSENTSKKFKG